MHRMNAGSAQRVSMSALLFASMMFAATEPAQALSCAAPSFTLQEAYDAADRIVVGLVTECERETSSDPWVGGGENCSFTSIEVLKESSPARDHGGVASSAACGLSLVVGEQYLLFLDRDNKPMYYSAPLSGEHAQGTLAKAYVRILQEFRSGAGDGLAEPWFVHASVNGCTVWQRVGGTRLTFSSSTTAVLPDTSYTWTQVTIDGRKAFKTVTPTFDGDGQAAQGQAEIVVYGRQPDESDAGLAFRVDLQERWPGPFREATVSVGSKSWPLYRMELTMAVGGRKLDPVASYIAVGDAAEEILAAMTKPSDIVVTAAVVETEADWSAASDPQAQGTAIRPYFGPTPAPDSIGRAQPNVRSAGARDAPPILSMESRSTQLSTVIDDFRACTAEAPD